MLGTFVSNAVTQLRWQAPLRWPLKGRYSVRTYFAVCSLLVVIPAVLATGWLEYRAASSERRQLEQKFLAQSQTATASLDREIQHRKNLLAMLALSSKLQDDNLEAFYLKITDVARELNIRIVLRDAATGTQLLNTAVPWGNLPIGQTFQEDFATQLRSGKTAVSNLFFGAYSQRYATTIATPITRGTSLAYFLSISLPSEELSAMLATIPLTTDEQRIGIIDRNGVVIASRDPNVIGRPVSTSFSERAGQVQGIVIRSNVQYHYFYNRSEQTGWYLDIGVPNSVFEAPFRRAMISTTMIGALLTLLSIAVAYGMGGRITHAMTTLKAAAGSLRQSKSCTASGDCISRNQRSGGGAIGCVKRPSGN